MTPVVKLFIEELDKHDMKHYPVQEDGERTTVSMGFGLKNTSLKINVIFDPGDHTVAIRCYGFLRVTENQFPQALLCCNDQNKKKRWVKFYIDDDFDVNVEDDAIVDNVTGGEELFELVMRMAMIADEAYPVFNKAIWS